MNAMYNYGGSDFSNKAFTPKLPIIIEDEAGDKSQFQPQPQAQPQQKLRKPTTETFHYAHSKDVKVKPTSPKTDQKVDQKAVEAIVDEQKMVEKKLAQIKKLYDDAQKACSLESISKKQAWKQFKISETLTDQGLKAVNKTKRLAKSLKIGLRHASVASLYANEARLHIKSGLMVANSSFDDPAFFDAINASVFLREARQAMIEGMESIDLTEKTQALLESAENAELAFAAAKDAADAAAAAIH